MSGLAARCALGAIRAYQRYLSPRKGFSCALRDAGGGRSCSSYGYRAIARWGLRKGLRLLRRRLDACGRQHRLGGGPLSYQQGSIDLGCALDAANVFDCCSGGCDLGGRGGSKKKEKKWRWR
jgi:putative component of membrane protein insertase Oxa1/YidC/SpoIIIJ protein YidD